MYTEKDLFWITLSLCNSYSTLPLSHALIKTYGLEDTIQIIRTYDGTIQAFSKEIFQNSYGNKFTTSYLNKSFEYFKEILAMKNVDTIVYQCEKIDVRIVTPNSEFWPKQLDLLEYDRPLSLWCRGNNTQLLNNENMISIVGSRKYSNYGKNIAIDFSYELAEKNFTIVSGGAYGIDTFSHIGALNSTGNTISVLAGGVDKLYPSSNESVFHSILEKGLIISENPIGSRPAKWKFLERNRIIAGLSKLTLLIEAPEKSGALNTINHAVEYGKTVGIIPANIDSPFGKGSNELLKQGAYPITSVKDILDLVGVNYIQEDLFDSIENENTIAQKRILSSLYKTKPKTIEELFLECELDIKQILQTLSFLETKGKCSRKHNGWILL